MKPYQEVNILWFRNALRLHDNASFRKAVDSPGVLLPIYIFDAETVAAKRCNYNKMEFLVESLIDLDNSFKSVGACLYCVKGNPLEVLKKLYKQLDVKRIFFEQDTQPAGLVRDKAIQDWCSQHDLTCVESVDVTLWNPLDVIEANGGSPPCNYDHFRHVTKALGSPTRPLPDINLSDINFADLLDNILSDMHFFSKIPSSNMFGFTKPPHAVKIYDGGESSGLRHFHKRVQQEKSSFMQGSFLPNHRDPDLLSPPKSLSPFIKLGCISIRKLYWAIIDAFDQVYQGRQPASYCIVSQLIWREFFHTMSADNVYFAEISRNPICINIPWNTDEDKLDSFLTARTGFPLIDAGMRQVKNEGWAHHVVLNAISMFLTRGDLWMSWIYGFDYLMRHQLDGDTAVCAGNWMWVSGSAFENSLNSSFSIDPGTYGRRFDPYGDYAKKYIPELRKYPTEYIYEPWKAPIEDQEMAGCIIGVDYPKPIVNHQLAMQENNKKMGEFTNKLLQLTSMHERNETKRRKSLCEG